MKKVKLVKSIMLVDFLPGEKSEVGYAVAECPPGEKLHVASGLDQRILRPGPANRHTIVTMIQK